VIVSLIVAIDQRGGIGKNNQLPWRLPSDLKRFKKLTMGHHLVMGRKTYETIGRPLPGRVMLIITHQKGYSAINCKVMSSLDAAVRLAKDAHETELFIIGGGEIFSQAIRLADKLYLTSIHTEVDADVFFPKINLNEWKVIGSEECVQNETDEYTSDFKVLLRQH
jgi:dihydrofolate reductase